MSEATSSLVEEISLNERIARQHAALLSFPEVLCPASRPSSPTSEERILDLKTRIAAAVNTAGGDPTNPKWGYVSRMVQLDSTSRKYLGVAPGLRTGEGRKVSVGKDFKWEMPEREEDWPAYEERWQAAVAEEKRRREGKVAAKSSRTSKYFTAPAAEAAVSGTRVRATSSKAEVIREKVERWQAQVATVPAAAPDAPMSQEPAVSPPSLKADKGKAKERVPQGEKVQASLGFRVVKRSSVTSAKGGSSGSSKPRVSPAGRVPTPPDDDPSPPPPDVPQDLADESMERPLVPEPPAVPKITDLPETSFLPPSFPSQLQTSTPPPNDRRQKPPPIPPCSPPPTSPSRLSVQSFDASRPQRHAPQQPSSSQPAVSPLQRPRKRARTPNPSPQDIRMSTPQSRSPRLKSPLSKKARVVPEQEPVSSGPAPAPPSTPPPSSPPARPVTPVSRGKGLGNAKGLPVPSTPDPHPLPTLTELLASSRRSRTRPRPPSRKNTPHSRAASRASDRMSEHELELPVVAEEEDDRSAREHTPEPSPAKTYFSSPASGSSDSPGSVVQRALSPVSPLFTQHPSAFLPKFASTQQPSGTDDPFSGGYGQQTQGSLMRGSSGFFAMGYSSQFDVEGHVEQVSELLERDVDFNGWIRDLGDDEAEGEGHDVDMPAAPSQSQENGAIDVGGY